LLHLLTAAQGTLLTARGRWSLMIAGSTVGCARSPGEALVHPTWRQRHFAHAVGCSGRLWWFRAQADAELGTKRCWVTRE